MRVRDLKFRLLLLAAASILCPGTGGAAQGVIEINQARAIAGGITLGDTQGFPVTLSTSGSYRLTSNLRVSDPNLSAIEISAEDVNLDLNGFVIAGPVACTGYGSTVSCGSGTGVGIASPSGNTLHVDVHDGTVRGFAGGGVVLDANLRIHHLIVASNGGNGIGGGAATVEDSIVMRNGRAGIFVVSGLVQRCIVNGNALSGIDSPVRVTIVGNLLSGNGLAGVSSITTQSNLAIRDNAVTLNESEGIQVNGSVVAHNVAYLNGGDGIDVGQGSLASDNVAQGNALTGIGADSGSLVERNTTTGNGADGLNLIPSTPTAPAAGYRENVSSGNGNKAVEGGAPLVGFVETDLPANSCNGQPSCP